MSGLAESLGIVDDQLTNAAMQLARADSELQILLRAVRESSGLSQADVAERMGVAVDMVQELESYWADPPLSVWRRYALAIGAVYTHSVSVYKTNPDDQIGANVD